MTLSARCWLAASFLQKVILTLIRPSIAFWRTTITPIRSLPTNVEQALAALLDYHPRVLRSHEILKDFVKKCCSLLDAELQSSPTLLYLINAAVPEGLANI